MQAKNLPNIYVLNRSPTKAVKAKTPYQARHKSKSRVEHLDVFGCISYAHITKENWEKLDRKVGKCLYVH